METLRVFWLFTCKQWMALCYQWKSFLMLLAGCIAIQFLMVHTTYQPIGPLEVVESAESTEELVGGCLFQMDPPYSGTFYSPNSSRVNQVMEHICGPEVFDQGFHQLSLMIKYLEACKEDCYGVHFHVDSEEAVNSTNEGNGRNTSASIMGYTIYTNHMKLDTEQRYITDSVHLSFSQTHSYRKFLKLQHSIDVALIELEYGKREDIMVSVGAMPSLQGGYYHNELGIVMGNMLALFLIVILVSTFIVPLVEEKEDGLKEFLVISTPLAYLNGLAFYVVHYVIYLLYGAIIITFAIAYQSLGIVPAIHGVILYVLFLTAMMSYSYLISVCFQKVFYAKTCGFLLHFMPSLIFDPLPLSLYHVSTYFFSLNTFIDAWDLIQIISNKYAVFEWGDLFKTVVDSKSSLGTMYIILLMQSVVYLLLYYYFESIFPGPGGIKQPYLFFLKKSFWVKGNTDQDHPRHATGCEEENSTNAIVVKNLVKHFHLSPERTITIADNLNMKINNKEVTVLLGHNGAGKTTIINMIMGLIDQDAGEITVCSEGNVSIYRHSIGYCPQHSIYMQYMTCRQHLIFFAKLRGLSSSKAKALATELLEQLRLSSKAGEYAKHLSGGMKRRLSLGMAIAGQTRVIILDEPSSGLDIESRRELWDVLLELRKTKAILITTHHMEEAEVLGDTIHILANGQLQMTGSPLELKRKVGSGYILKLCVDQNQFNLDNCLEEIRHLIPNARLMNVLPATVSICLPYEHRQSYHLLLALLEEQQRQLAITTISMTDTTLEDVFLNSAGAKDETDALEMDQVDVPYQRIDIQYQISSWQQFKAIAYKKCIFIRNNYWLSLLMFALPFIFTTFAILAIHASAFQVFGEGLDLKLDHYDHGIVYLSRSSVDTNPRIEKITELLKQQIDMQQKRIKIVDLILNSDENIEKELMFLMQKDFFAFQHDVIGCIHIDDGSSTGNGRLSITTHYSMNMLHSSAILLNVIDNAIGEWSSPMKQVPASQIHTIYAPLVINDSSADSLNLVYYTIFATAGIFMLMLYFVVLPFREHRSGFKRLQPISSTALWCNSFICDLLVLLAICLLLFGYHLVITPSYLYNVDDLFNITLALYFYGLSYLPLIYNLSSAFTSLSALSAVLILIFFLSVVPSFILSSTVGDMLRYEKYILFLRLLPDFNLMHQLRVINERFVNNHIPQISDHVRDLLNNRTVLKLGTFYFYVLFVAPLLMIILLMLVENRRRRERFMELLRCKRRINKSQQCPTPNKEEDRLVQEERRTVEKIIKDGDEREHPLVVRNLYKYYKPHPAVSGLSFAVHKKECFGLLGVNGAGKTTTFEMIAANNTISAGSIQIEGIDQQLKRKQYRYQFGYCPQDDCLNDFMTSYQMLKFMALLRGVCTSGDDDGSTNILEAEINYWLARLDLRQYRSVQVRHYSGGTKRKLQTATAMIGSPWLVLLDEPTTGVDPISRRFLWQSMQDFQKRSRTIVLTSHSMDECEYLCNRLAIMAEGQFKCLGHVPELKQMYGSGFTINVQVHASVRQDMNEAMIQTITEHLREHFQECLLRENHAGILTYFVRSSQGHLRWSQIFERAEMFLDEVQDLVEEYSINETTLEDIFLRYYKRSANGSFSISIHD